MHYENKIKQLRLLLDIAEGNLEQKNQCPDDYIGTYEEDVETLKWAIEELTKDVDNKVFVTIKWSRDDLSSSLDDKNVDNSRENIDLLQKKCQRWLHEGSVKHGNEIIDDSINDLLNGGELVEMEEDN